MLIGVLQVRYNYYTNFHVYNPRVIMKQTKCDAIN